MHSEYFLSYSNINDTLKFCYFTSEQRVGLQRCSDETAPYFEKQIKL